MGSHGKRFTTTTLCSNIQTEKQKEVVNKMDKFYTVKEVCEITRIGKTVIYDAIESGELPAAKLHGQWRISETGLKAWIESSMNNKGGK